MRTITQRTTLPFLIAESGAASFTLAVITSPSPARSPRSPPRRRIHDSFRAPELSATSRMVRIPIIIGSQLSAISSQLHLDIEIGRLRTHLGCSPDDLRQRPSLQLAQRAVLHDTHHIAHLGCT